MTRSYISRSDKPKAAARNVTAIKAYILNNQGAGLEQLCGHIERTAQIVHTALGTLRVDEWLFVQMRGSKAYYYSADYAAENNLKRRISTLGNRSKKTPPPVVETVRVCDMLRLNALWPVNS